MKCKAITLYLWGLKIREVYQSDVLIIGSGIAGLSSAIHISQLRPDLKITIVSKTTKEEGNTRYAQGGISAVWNLEEDSFEKHIADTLDAGDDLCDQRIVRLVVEEGPTRVKELIDWGANFDKSATTGAYDLAREGGRLLVSEVPRGISNLYYKAKMPGLLPCQPIGKIPRYSSFTGKRVALTFIHLKTHL